MQFLKHSEVATAELPTGPGWKLLIVDDEEEVHRVTRLVLQDLRFAGAQVVLIDAYSGEEAVAVMREQPDIAVILMDIVMEAEQAGWEAVRRIRNELDNHLVQIIVRTGYPGGLTESGMVAEFQINDFREKGELTRERMYLAILTALASYRSQSVLKSTREALDKLVGVSASLSSHGAEIAALRLAEFARAMQVRSSLIVIDGRNGRSAVFAGTGLFAVDSEIGQLAVEAGPAFADIVAALERPIASADDTRVIRHQGAAGRRVLLCLHQASEQIEEQTLYWFIKTVIAAIDLHEQMAAIDRSLNELFDGLHQASEQP